MRQLRAQWCVQMNGFIFGTCVLSYQSHPYKESAFIPVTMESWCGYETVECTTLIFLEVSKWCLPEMTRRFESPRIYEIPSSQPIRCKTKTNGNLVPHVFPRLKQFPCFFFSTFSFNCLVMILNFVIFGCCNHFGFGNRLIPNPDKIFLSSYNRRTTLCQWFTH